MRHQGRIAVAVASATTVASLMTGGVAFATTTTSQGHGHALNKQDRMYLKEAAQGDLFEVAGGHIAVRHSHRHDVRAFGRRMIRDHSKEYVSVKETAHEVGVRVPKSPSEEQQKVLRHWQSLWGHHFDCAYIRFEVADHKHDIALTKDEIRLGRNEKVVNEAKSSLPVLESHLAQATFILKRMPSCH